MNLQSSTEAVTPPGLVYVPGFVDEDEENSLIALLLGLPYQDVLTDEETAHRGIVHYGWQYDSSNWTLSPAPALPAFLDPLRRRAAALTGIESARFEQALVARYPPGATVGWHRDAPRFGPVVVGVSLLAPCRMRFRRGPAIGRQVLELALAPRSAYVLSGPARTLWQHSVLPVPALRLSVTFRTLGPDSPSTT